jgi:hypothetical protein
MKRKSELSPPSGEFAVILIRYNERVFVVHDPSHCIMTFATPEACFKFIISNNDAIFTNINWVVFAPKVATVTHEFLQGIMLRLSNSAVSYKISNLSGMAMGYELDWADGNTLYGKAQSPNLFA